MFQHKLRSVGRFPLTLKLWNVKLRLGKGEQNVIYCKRKKVSTLTCFAKLQWTHFYRIHRSHDVHNESHEMPRYVWTEAEIFLSTIKVKKKKITVIPDREKENISRNEGRGIFQKPGQMLRSE